MCSLEKKHQDYKKNDRHFIELYRCITDGSTVFRVNKWLFFYLCAELFDPTLFKSLWKHISSNSLKLKSLLNLPQLMNLWIFLLSHPITYLRFTFVYPSAWTPAGWVWVGILFSIIIILVIERLSGRMIWFWWILVSTERATVDWC